MKTSGNNELNGVVVSIGNEVFSATDARKMTDEVKNNNNNQLLTQIKNCIKNRAASGLECAKFEFDIHYIKVFDNTQKFVHSELHRLGYKNFNWSVNDSVISVYVEW
jgi:hypothetical protein